MTHSGLTTMYKLECGTVHHHINASGVTNQPGPLDIIIIIIIK